MYRGWHFSADKQGCSSMKHLMELMKFEISPTHRTILVSDPRPAGVDRIFGEHSLAVQTPKKIRFCLDSSTETEEFHMSDEIFVMTLLPNDIDEFSKALNDIAAGRGDFGVSLGACRTILNFWTWPKMR